MRKRERGGSGRLRWILLALLFASTVLNYLDRQALSILASTIQLDLHMSDLAYAHIVQGFLLAYTVAYLLAGRITDGLGSRLALALFVGWWSVANLLTGLVRSTWQLGAARFALGLGEPGNYTVGPKVVSEHFPPAERGMAMGIYTAGAMVGATLAPPLIGGLAIAYGWRAAFLATGLVGLIWMSVWLRLHPLEARPARVAGARGEASLWMELLRDRPLWLLTLARGLTDPVWYFYLFWFPKYLNDERGMTLAAVASLAWIVYLAADLGSIGGGLLSSALVRRGVMPPRSRLLVMTGAAIVGPVSLFAAFHPALLVLFVIAGAVALAHMVFLINISTLVVDLYPTRAVATVFGIFGAGSGLGGMLSTQVVGHLVASGRFDHCFMLMAALHPLALGLVWLALRMAPGSRLVAKTAGLQVTSSA